MGNCARFGAVSGDGLPREMDGRESVCGVVLSGGELDGGEGELQCGCPHKINEFCKKNVIILFTFVHLSAVKYYCLFI